MLSRALMSASGGGRRALGTAASRLTADSMNAHVLAAEYAVRGSVVIRAGEHEHALARGESRPFDKVVYCNIGNPQQLGQAPMSFARDVLAAMDCPRLLETDVFAEDVKERAKRYLDRIPGGTGAYSHSQGVEIVREEVVQFLEKRDGVAANPNHIFLTDGASPAVQLLMRAMLRDETDAVLIPIPQYPLYTASIALCGGSAVGYYLDESKGWETALGELERAFAEAKDGGKLPRAVAVINPGNPTGGVLGRETVAAVAKFCADQNLVLLADEVYQENVWASGKEFFSFKRVASEEGLLGDDGSGEGLQLASFHSVSKGFLGECGRRGGYVELCGFDDEARAQLYKVASVSLCSNVAGQIAVGVMVNPPREGDASFAQWQEEKSSILASLKRRAATLSAAFEEMEGVHCAPPEGALYAFPTITLPPAAVEEAATKGIAPDLLYCLQLLDHTGVVVVPGSGFGQKEGTFHFRTTILPPEDEIGHVAKLLQDFHKGFLEKYA